MVYAPDEVTARRIAYKVADDNCCGFNESVVKESSSIWAVQLRNGPGGDRAVAVVNVWKRVDRAQFFWVGE